MSWMSLNAFASTTFRTIIISPRNRKPPWKKGFTWRRSQIKKASRSSRMYLVWPFGSSSQMEMGFLSNAIHPLLRTATGIFWWITGLFWSSSSFFTAAIQAFYLCRIFKTIFTIWQTKACWVSSPIELWQMVKLNRVQLRSNKDLLRNPCR